MTPTSGSHNRYGEVDDPNSEADKVLPGARCLPVAPTSPEQKGRHKRLFTVIGFVIFLVIGICVAVAVPLTRKHNDSKGQSQISGNVTVAQDGSGQYSTIQAAVNGAPSKSTTPYVIYIKQGTYEEQVIVPSDKTYLTCVGDGIGNTVISGSLNVMMPGITTFLSATLIVQGAHFIGRDFTVRNVAGPLNQAVALRVSADKVAFWRVSLEAYQNTLYAHSHRQFYKDCTIAGTVDFIFGNAAAVFQSCNMVVRLPGPGQQNTVTAQGRTDPSQATGLAFFYCNINGNKALWGQVLSVPTFLGRPWKLYSRTVFIRSYLSAIVNPSGWLNWAGAWGLVRATMPSIRTQGRDLASRNGCPGLTS